MLVGESYLARRRPVYECTDVQVDITGNITGNNFLPSAPLQTSKDLTYPAYFTSL
jgi:hypothetical protein